MMRFILSLFCVGLLLHNAVGQPVGKDSTVSLAARQAVARYEEVSNTLERLYNGPEYISYDRRLTGHPFFPTDTLLEGKVAYQGGQFAVPLLYDIVKDEVVVVHSGGYRMSLHSDRVQAFSVRNHTFIRLDSVQQGMSTGFYDMLYSGNIQLLARRTKSVLINLTAFSYGLFTAKTTYYILKNGQYSPVRNKRTLLAVLSNRRKQLVAYARAQKLSFRPSPETAILKLTQHYDELTKSL